MSILNFWRFRLSEELSLVTLCVPSFLTILIVLCTGLGALGLSEEVSISISISISTSISIRDFEICAFGGFWSF